MGGIDFSEITDGPLERAPGRGRFQVDASIQILVLLSLVTTFFLINYVERYLNIFNQVFIGWVVLVMLIVTARVEISYIKRNIENS